MGLHPDGLSGSDFADTPPPAFMPYREARRSAYFFAVSVAYLFLLGAQVGAIMHFYRLASTREGAHTAALALAVLATTSTIGRLAGGGLLLKVPARAFALVLMAFQALGLALLALAQGRTAILAATVVFAATIGNSLMMHPLLLAERFGTRDYGRIYSTSQMVTVLGVAGCPALIGLLYDLIGRIRAAVSGCGRPDADRTRDPCPVRRTPRCVAYRLGRRIARDGSLGSVTYRYGKAARLTSLGIDMHGRLLATCAHDLAAGQQHLMLEAYHLVAYLQYA